MCENYEKLSEIIKEFESSINNINNRLDKDIVNDLLRKMFYEEINTKLTKTFISIFGKDNDLNDHGLTDDLIKYEDLKDAVLFSQWSFKGLLHQFINEVIEHKDFRKNPFYKGKRWSIPENKDRFYKPFEIIKSHSKNLAPVDFFSQQGIKNNFKYIKIITSDLAGCKAIKDGENLELRLPKLTLNSTFESSTMKRHILRIIRKNRKLNVNSGNTGEQIVESIRGITDWNTLCIQSFNEMMACKDKRIIDEWYGIFKEAFSIDGNMKKNDSFEPAISGILNKRKMVVFQVILLYQFYDIPYDIHLFLPAYDNNIMNQYDIELPLSCFAISLSQNTAISDLYIRLFKEFADILEVFTNCDVKIWEKHAENLVYYDRWEKIYQVIYEKYYRAAIMIESVCYEVCRKAVDEDYSYRYGIMTKPSYMVTKRIKSFHSLYNKMVNKINTSKMKNKSELIKKFRMEPILENSPKPKNKDKSIGDALDLIKKLKIKDIAGIRIICTYNNEVNSIFDKFNKHFNGYRKGEKKKLNSKSEFIFEYKEWDVLDDNNPEHYRSKHLWMKFGKPRMNQFEVKAVKDLIVEIQIRTMLSHGWADVAHDLYYKPQLSLKVAEKFKEDIRTRLTSSSMNLDNLDDMFVELYEKYCNLLIKENE
ncbi:MAG: hypothetical protein ACFFDN_27185 [Candidatus Hodarchaeota archaeon]